MGLREWLERRRIDPSRGKMTLWWTGGGVGEGGSHRHHVVTLHIGLVLILALVVELPEEVEGHHGVEVHDHGQQPHRQHQLGGERRG